MKETLNILCTCYNSIKKTLTCIHKLLSPQQQKLSKRACLIAKIPIWVCSIYNSLRAVDYVNHSWSFVSVLLHSVCHMFVRLYGFFQGADTHRCGFTAKGFYEPTVIADNFYVGGGDQLRSRGQWVVFLWKIHSVCVPSRWFQIYRRKKAFGRQASDNVYPQSLIAIGGTTGPDSEKTK